MESVVASFKIEKEYLDKIDYIAKSRSNTRSEYLAYLIRREVDSVIKYGIDYFVFEEFDRKFPNAENNVSLEETKKIFKSVIEKEAAQTADK